MEKKMYLVDVFTKRSKFLLITDNKYSLNKLVKNMFKLFPKKGSCEILLKLE